MYSLNWSCSRCSYILSLFSVVLSLLAGCLVLFVHLPPLLYSSRCGGFVPSTFPVRASLFPYRASDIEIFRQQGTTCASLWFPSLLPVSLRYLDGLLYISVGELYTRRVTWGVLYFAVGLLYTQGYLFRFLSLCSTQGAK